LGCLIILCVFVVPIRIREERGERREERGERRANISFNYPAGFI